MPSPRRLDVHFFTSADKGFNNAALRSDVKLEKMRATTLERKPAIVWWNKLVQAVLESAIAVTVGCANRFQQRENIGNKKIFTVSFPDRDRRLLLTNSR